MAVCNEISSLLVVTASQLACSMAALRCCWSAKSAVCMVDVGAHEMACVKVQGTARSWCTVVTEVFAKTGLCGQDIGALDSNTMS